MIDIMGNRLAGGTRWQRRRTITLTGRPLTGHTRAVTGVAFGTTRDGRLLLASASGDATVQVWLVDGPETVQRGEAVQTLAPADTIAFATTPAPDQSPSWRWQDKRDGGLPAPIGAPVMR